MADLNDFWADYLCGNDIPEAAIFCDPSVVDPYFYIDDDDGYPFRCYLNGRNVYYFDSLGDCCVVVDWFDKKLWL